MVLWLKRWESRSPPGLPRTRNFLFTCHDQTKRRFPSGRRRFLFAQNALPFVSDAGQNCVLHESRIPGSNSIETEDQVQDPFISKFVRSFACKLERPHLQEIPMRALFRPVATALTIVCFAASFAALSTHSALAQA